MSTESARHLSSFSIDDMPDDPEAVAKLLEPKPENTESATEDPKGSDQTAVESVQPKADDNSQKDHPNAIPLDRHTAILDAQRAQVAEAQQRAQDALERAKQMEAEIARIKAGGSTTQGQVDEGEKATEQMLDELDSSIEMIRGDAPTLATTLAGMRAFLADLQSKVSTQASVIQRYETERETEEQNQARRGQSEVQQAIDSIPELAYLRDAAPKDEAARALWHRAVILDQTLRGVDAQNNRIGEPDREYVQKSYAERFQQVVKVMEAMHGKFKVPEQYGGQPAKAAMADIEKRAKEALAKASNTTLTLSDIPGGVLPNTSERASLGDRVAGDLERLFDGKSDAEIDAMLARGAA